jgi:hypothetical protein
MHITTRDKWIVALMVALAGCAFMAFRLEIWPLFWEALLYVCGLCLLLGPLWTPLAINLRRLGDSPIVEASHIAELKPRPVESPEMGRALAARPPFKATAGRTKVPPSQ